MANERPTIIHFEELNRSTLAVRNAALQILLEREIGAFFKFNDNVLMCASGNLGEEDGTDVEEFDQALNNRLIHITHMLPFPEWREQFGDENVHPVVVGFLKNYTEYYYKKPDDKSVKAARAYATPRSWTFLSDYIFVNYGEWVRDTDPSGKELFMPDGTTPKMRRSWPSVRLFINDLQEIANGYVGPAAVRFIRYCQDTLKITLSDILDRFDEIETDVKAFNRDKKSELITNMKEQKVSNLKAKQIENLTKFLCTISDDEIVGYLLHVLDTEYNLSEENKENKVAEKFLSDKRFAKFRDAIMKHVDDEK
jgi:hypothetical protein